MKCDRCGHELNFVYEDVIESVTGNLKENVYHVQEYYCAGCKSCMIQTYANEGLVKSEWIDFDGK